MMSRLDDDQHKDSGEWPYHVAFPAKLWQGTDWFIITGFCKGFKICDICYSVKHEGVDCVVYQFADLGEAEQFCSQFDGRLIEHKP